MVKLRAVGCFAGSVGLLLAWHSSAFAVPSAVAGIVADPERALVAVLSLVGWLLALWLCTVSALALLATSASSAGRQAGALARFLAPVATRRLLEAALGFAVIAAPSGVAAAATVPAPAASAVPALAPVPPPIVAPEESPLPTLDRPVAAPATALPATPPDGPELPGPELPRLELPGPDSPGPVARGPMRPEQAAPGTPPAAVTHRVLAGDTLWAIAADALPPGAPPADIVRAWQQWYTANLQTIGLDPNLLFPGQLLTAPAAPAAP